MTDTTTDAATTSTGTATGRDIRLSINTPSGRLPMNLAGFLMQAIGRAYPGTQIDTTGDGLSGFGAVLSLRIPYADYINSDGLTEQDFAEITPGKDDPGLVAFTSGFSKSGGLKMGPPPWLATLLRSTAETLHDALGDAPNYLAIELPPQDGGEPFTWIVCRRGRPSPHALRMAVEDRVRQLEAQLRDAGIEPAPAADADAEA